jgi:hypothetical protein
MDGVGGRVPNPRNDRAASASTAIANDTDACTSSRPAMLGSTCRTAIAARGRPAARAARMYSVASTCSVPARASRANDGTVAMPIATIAVSVLGP